MELGARSRIRTKPLVKDRWDGINGSRKGPGKIFGHRKYWDKLTENIRDLEKPPRWEHPCIKWETPAEEA